MRIELNAEEACSIPTQLPCSFHTSQGLRVIDKGSKDGEMKIHSKLSRLTEATGIDATWQ